MIVRIIAALFPAFHIEGVAKAVAAFGNRQVVPDRSGHAAVHSWPSAHACCRVDCPGRFYARIVRKERTPDLGETLDLGELLAQESLELPHAPADQVLSL